VAGADVANAEPNSTGLNRAESNSVGPNSGGVNSAEVFGALQIANGELGVTVLIVTHDPAVSSVVRRVVAIRDGRTSTEIHREAVQTDDGELAHHAIEYAVLDRAGRLQLPKEMTEPLGMHDLVRLEGESDHIGVWPDDRENQ